MSTITCLKELEEKRILEFEDIVEFNFKKEKIRYRVSKAHLLNDKGSLYNDYIFEILKIDKNKIAQKTYNYKADIGCWPTSEIDDYPALTRLVKELYIIIEEREIIYTKFSRFEIMEI